MGSRTDVKTTTVARPFFSAALCGIAVHGLRVRVTVPPAAYSAPPSPRAEAAGIKPTPAPPTAQLENKGNVGQRNRAARHVQAAPADAVERDCRPQRNWKTG